MSEHDKWHWQEGRIWRGVGIYHVTMVVPSRRSLLGDLVIPNNDPEQAYVARKELGNRLVDELVHIHAYYPEILILQYCLMPDHLHAIIYVRHAMKKSINEVVRGFWQGAKKIARMSSLSVTSELNSDQINEDYIKADPIFTEKPFIRPLSHKGQLQTMIRYVQMNPQRLAYLMLQSLWQQQIYYNHGWKRRPLSMPIAIRRDALLRVFSGDGPVMVAWKQLFSRDSLHGFWHGAKKIARMTSSSDTSELNSDQINEDYIKADHIFT